MQNATALPPTNIQKKREATTLLFLKQFNKQKQG
jgi:hypothetical protein